MYGTSGLAEDRRRLMTPARHFSLPLLLPSSHRFPSTMSTQLKGSLWALFTLVAVAAAHGGHENVPEGSAVSEDPIVRVVSCPVSSRSLLGLLLT